MDPQRQYILNALGAASSSSVLGNSPNSNSEEWWAYGYVCKGWRDCVPGDEFVSFRFDKGPIIALNPSESESFRKGIPGETWKDDLQVKVTFHLGGSKVKRVREWDGKDIPHGEVRGEIPTPPKK